MENNSYKLEELIRQSNDKKKYIDIASLPGKPEMNDAGYHFVDENEYIITTAAYMSLFHPESTDFAQSMVLKRDFEYEFKNLDKINRVIPENSVKPIALVYDNSVSKDYIRGYLTETNGKITNLKDYINLKEEKNADLSAGDILDIETQLTTLADKLKTSGMYNRLPDSTFSIKDIYITEKNKVVLMNMNYLMDFSDKNPKSLDKELKNTIKYLDKAKSKRLYYMHGGKNNATPHY
jgi:hypothetical protein